MKTLKNSIYLLAVLGILSSCSQGSSVITPQGITTPKSASSSTTSSTFTTITSSSLPQSILNYLSTNYSALTISKAEKDNNGKYEVTLSNGIKVHFDASGNFLSASTNGSSSTMTTSSLPQAILTYITTNYSTLTISKVEKDSDGQYQVTLSNGYSLEFDASGNFLSLHTNNDATSTTIAASSLPQAILTYITTNYSALTISKAEKDSNGHYEVTLSDGTEVYFDANGNFISVTTGNDGSDSGNDNGSNDATSTTIAASSLPQAILTYITTNYSALTISKAEKDSNGHYEVTLSNGTEVYFDANGNFISVTTGNDGSDSGNDNGSNDANSTAIAASSLPQVILTYITTNYSALTISKAEKDSNGHYEVTLSNGTEVYFDANGNFISVTTGNDGSDSGNDNGSNDANSTTIAASSLPQIVLTYITTNYSALTISKAEKDSNGHYEVTLSNGTEVYFDANGNFISVTTGNDGSDSGSDG